MAAPTKEYTGPQKLQVRGERTPLFKKKETKTRTREEVKNKKSRPTRLGKEEL